MLTEKKFQENENYACIEFHNVLKDTIPWLEHVANEYRCKIEKKEWRSKYNNYVVYDYEPFCSEGFEITIIMSCKCQNFLNFVRYLYEEKMQLINYLNDCIMV